MWQAALRLEKLKLQVALDPDDNRFGELDAIVGEAVKAECRTQHRFLQVQLLIARSDALSILAPYKVKWTIRRPAQDAFLVAIATGPGITAPHWAIPKPYQPTSKVWNPRVLGATNPIWLDADGDGKFTPLRKQK